MSKSSTLAVALAGLAVVIAATGTAVAVTATQVNITDPTTPAHVARVDASGRLNVISPTAAYAYSSLLNVGSTDNFITVPTKATLGLTNISLSHPQQVAGAANTNLRVALYKATSSSTTSCVPTAYQQLAAWNLEPGDDITADFSNPLVVKASGSSYCLDLFVYTITGSAYGANYYPFGSAQWSVMAGTYTGPGTSVAQLTPAQVKAKGHSGADR